MNERPESEDVRDAVSPRRRGGFFTRHYGGGDSRLDRIENDIRLLTVGLCTGFLVLIGALGFAYMKIDDRLDEIATGVAVILDRTDRETPDP